MSSPFPKSLHRNARHATPRHALLFLAALFLTTAGLRGQELSYLAGGGTLPNFHSSTFSWDLDYRQHLLRYFSASVGWINEGHIIGHHRDGTSGELWLEAPLFKGRLTLAAGAGGYYYFDTEPAMGGSDSVDLHGSAPMVSFSATAYVTDRWFARFLINRINPHDDFKSNTALLGIGYWFGQDKRPLPHELGAAPEDKGFVTGDQLTVFGGESIVNAAFSSHGQAYAAEYRRGLCPHVDGTVAYIYEGDPRLVRRSGLGLQLWPVNTFFDQRITVGMGLGVYVYIDNKHPGAARQLPVGGSVNTPALAPLISPTIAVKLSENWLIRGMWHRVVSDYNRDSDVFLLGLGYRLR